MATELLTVGQIDAYLGGALAHARASEYYGWSKHDALNSPVLEAMSLGRRLPRLVLTQAVMRCPIDVRRLLGVRRMRNNKGLALFARALLDRGRALSSKEDLGEARTLLDTLLENAVPCGEGIGWGYPYPWQDAGFFAPRDFPNRVVTCFVAQALMEGYAVLSDRRYLEEMDKVLVFLLDAPSRMYESLNQLCLSYVPRDDVTTAVLDVNILVAAVVARYAAQTGKRERLGDARRLAAFVVDKQTDYHAWYYTHPAQDSPITHDNYHTGFILDGLHEYMHWSGDFEWAEAYAKGLAFYRDRLFEPDGAPRWRHNRPYPRDVHGSAQGILTFLRAADNQWGGPQYRELAHKVAHWACDNLWLPGPRRFAWQKTRRGLKTHDLLRWCQGWMARALAALLRYEACHAARSLRSEVSGSDQQTL